jgi:hypothetical protein
MNPNIIPSNRGVLVGVIDPDLNAAGTLTTAWVNMGLFETIQAIILAGALGTNATLDAKLEQATDSSGTGAKDISGKAITQLTQAGTDESDQQAIINCRSDELDVANNFAYVRLSMTVAVASSDSCAVVLGHDARYQPAADAASVAEVVS